MESGISLHGRLQQVGAIIRVLVLGKSEHRWYCCDAARSHPVVDDDEEDDVDEEDEDIPALMQSSDDGMSYHTEDDASHLSSRSDVSDEEGDDDEDGDESDGDSKEGLGTDMPPLVSDRDPFGEVESQSAGWHTAEEDSTDEAERHGGSPQGRRVRRRRVSPIPSSVSVGRCVSQRCGVSNDSRLWWRLHKLSSQHE